MTDAALNPIQSIDQSISVLLIDLFKNIYGLLKIVNQIHVITKIDQDVDGIVV